MNFLTTLQKCDRIGSVVGVATSPKGNEMTARGEQSKSILLGVALLGHARPQIHVRSGQRPAGCSFCIYRRIHARNRN